MTTTAVHIVWFVAVAPGRPEIGPLRTGELKAMAADGRLLPAMLVRRIGMPRAVPAAQVKGLFDAATPAAARASAPIAPAPRLAAEITPADDGGRALTAPVSTPPTPPTAILASARRAVRRGRAAQPPRAARAKAANPSAAPERTAATSRDEGPAAAGFARRSAAFVLDLVLVAPLIAIVALGGVATHQAWLVAASCLVGAAYRTALDARGGTWGKRALGVRVVGRGGAAIGLGASALRNAPFIVDAVAQATLELVVLGATAAAAGGAAAGASRPLVFALLGTALVAGAFWLVSCLCVLGDRGKRALHDRLAGSRCVVAAAAAAPARTRVQPKRGAARARPSADRPTAPIAASDPPTTPTAPAPQRAVTTRRVVRRAG